MKYNSAPKMKFTSRNKTTDKAVSHELSLIEHQTSPLGHQSNSICLNNTTSNAFLLKKPFLILILLLLAPIFIAADCEGDDQQLLDPTWKIYVTFINNSSQDTHFYGPSEMAGPANKLAPGGTLNRTYPIVQWATPKTITLYAFRNGEVISTHVFSLEFEGKQEFTSLTASYPW